jgi:hypothetical protein
MAELVLKKPLEFGKLTIDKLTFRDYVTAGDMLVFDTQGNVAQNIELIANLTGTDEAMIKQLHRVDYNAAVGIVNRLFKDDVTEDDAEKK